MKIQSLYRAIPILRLLARTTSLLSLGWLVIYLMRTGFDSTQLTSSEWAGLIFFPIGVIIGLGLGWLQEWAGGLITMVSVLAYYLFLGMPLTGYWPADWTFLVYAIPGALFLAGGWLAYHQTNQS